MMRRENEVDVGWDERQRSSVGFGTFSKWVWSAWVALRKHDHNPF